MSGNEPPRKKQLTMKRFGFITLVPSVNTSESDTAPKVVDFNSDAAIVTSTGSKFTTKENVHTEGGNPSAVGLLRFKQSWLGKHKWLQYDDAKNLMYCKLCKDKKYTNTMALGTSNFKATTLSRHVENRQHVMAVCAPVEQENMSKALNSALTKEEHAITVCMQVVKWLCMEVIPLSKYHSLMSLLHELKTPNIDSLKVTDKIDYSSYDTALDLLKTLSDTIDASVTKKIIQSPVITIMSDESTDIMVHHKLVINCRIVNPTTLAPSTVFLTDLRITSATGQGIYNAIKDHLDIRGINISSITGLGTDGAAVMTGTGEGLTGHFLRENPHLINCHCSAHRVALVSEQAANSVPAMKEYQNTIVSIYYHFKKSPMKCDKLLAIQKVLDDPQIKYREVHSVRWLSFYNAVEAVYRTFDSLLTYMLEAGVKDPAASGLKKKIGTDFFIETTYHLMDILLPIMRLNLFFQKRDVDIGNVQSAVETCVNDLTAMIDGEVEGTFARKLNMDLDKGIFKGQHEIQTSKYHASGARNAFLRALLDNLDKRFPDKDLMTALCVLGLKPIHHVDKEDLQNWGNESMDILLNNYGVSKTHTHKDKITKLVSTNTSDPMVDSEDAKREWQLLKTVVIAQKYPVKSTSKLWELVSVNHREQFPNILLLASIALAHPVHTSDCERSFSAQNQITTALRNRISSEHCDEIMRVKIEGQNIDFGACLRDWRMAKQRALFGYSKCPH